MKKQQTDDVPAGEVPASVMPGDFLAANPQVDAIEWEIGGRIFRMTRDGQGEYTGRALEDRCHVRLVVTP